MEPSSNWKLIALGCGFYGMLLHSPKDKVRVRSTAPINLEPSIFQVQPWTPYFSTCNQKATNAEVCASVGFSVFNSDVFLVEMLENESHIYGLVK